MTDNTQSILDVENTEWPSFYPKGVPPKESKLAEGEFFRIVKRRPPSKDCFLSMYQATPKRLKKFNGLKLKCCYGISVYTEEHSIKNAFDKFPEGAGNFFIAKGTVNADDGNMLKTFDDPAHYTLWLKNNNKIYEKFSCVIGLSK